MHVGETHVWRMRLPEDALDESDAWDVLSDDEREAADRLVRPDDRAARIQTRALLRGALGRMLGCPAADVPIETTTDGKPVIGSPFEGSGVHFSVSHSGSAIVIAIGVGLNVGVDVEEVQESFGWQEVAATVLTNYERGEIDRLPTWSQQWAFFEYWVRKEAYLKGLGMGLKRDPSGFSVPLGIDGGLVDDPLERDRSDSVWTVRGLYVRRRFAAALAHQGDTSLVLH
jgi:4'-phosphopantetheinyl transferase